MMLTRSVDADARTRVVSMQILGPPRAARDVQYAVHLVASCLLLGFRDAGGPDVSVCTYVAPDGHRGIVSVVFGRPARDAEAFARAAGLIEEVMELAFAQAIETMAASPAKEVMS